MDMLMKAAFPLLANLLADELGLTVVWMAGVPPHADSKLRRIVLPPDVDPVAALGLLIHEAGHFLLTDNAEWQKRIAGDKTRHAFGNAIEDIWMEREVMRKYPGARKRLNDLLISLQRDGRIKNGRHPVIDYFHTKLRLEHLGQSIEPELMQEATELFLGVFDEQKKADLDLLLEEIEHVDSTMKCFDLSEKIIALFESQQQQEEQGQESQGSGKQSDEGESQSAGEEKGESGEESSDAQSAGKEQSEEGDSGQGGESDEGDQAGDSEGGDKGESADGDEADDGEQAAGAGGQSQGGEQAGDSKQADEGKNGGEQSKAGEQPGDAGQQSSSGEGEGSGQGANKGAVEDFTFQGVGEMIMEAIEEAIAEAQAQQAASGGGHSGEEQGVSRVSQSSLVDEGEMYDVVPSYVKGHHPKVQPPSATAQLRRGLSALLQGESLVKQRSSLNGKKVVPTKLWSTKYGGRAFKSVTQGIKRNAAIHLTLDVSGSMAGTPIEVAKKAVLSVASAVEKTPGVDVVVSTFGSDVNVLKTPSAIMRSVASGGTAMAPAVKTGGMQLMQSSKDNKILLVVTDGAPHQPAWTRRMIEACQACGITVVGVGIGTMAVEDLFDHHVVINDVAELPKTLLGCLREVL